MADDKLPDSPDGSDESIPTDPTGAELAGDDRSAGDPSQSAGGSGEKPAELTDDAEIVDSNNLPGDSYVDDPATPDINEAKLDRATDEAAAEDTVDPGSTAPRRPRANRPVRRRDGGSPVESGGVRDVGASAVEPTGTPAESSSSDARGGSTPARVGGGRTRTTAPIRKERTTGADTGDRRTTPALFVRQSVGELRKVVWPTGNQVQQYFIVVLVFVLFIMTVVSLLDLGFGWAILRLFG